jgi:hypothetical protein
MSLVRRAAKRSKYGAIKQTVDGIVFHSKREAKRYCELRLLEKAGEIQNLELQPKFVLTVDTGPETCEMLGNYIADFAYHDKATGKIVVEDSKGFRTPLYRWKKKHVEAQYGIEIREV